MGKFKNKDGSLTRYAFACGYIQEKEVKNPKGENITIQLYHEGAVYQVRAYDNTNKSRLVWNSYDDTDLTAARSNFALLAKHCKSGFIDYDGMNKLETQLAAKGYALANERI